MMITHKFMHPEAGYFQVLELEVDHHTPRGLDGVPRPFNCYGRHSVTLEAAVADFYAQCEAPPPAPIGRSCDPDGYDRDNLGESPDF